MNKRLIASLLAVCIATGTNLHIPVKLLANTSDTYTSVVQEKQILESNGLLSSQFTEIDLPRYEEYEGIFKVKDIKQYTNNGRQYSSSALAYAFDGDVKTHW